MTCNLSNNLKVTIYCRKNVNKKCTFTKIWSLDKVLHFNRRNI